MPTWQDIKTIDTYYQASKGPFRQFFRTRSEFMRWLSVLIQSHAPTDPLTQEDKFQLLQKIVVYPLKQQAKLSFEMAIRVMALCIAGEKNVLVFNALKVLHQANLFNWDVFARISADQNASAFAEGILGSKEINGNACIYFLLGQWYERDGAGISSDYSRALRFYDQAADLKHIPALIHLGHFYQSDHPGIPTNDEKSFHYYLRAANLGSEQAWPMLIRLAKDNDARWHHLSQSPYSYFFEKERVALLPENTSTLSLQH
ncbi:tetratricopeptide repeat protein [Candidiatus Paracoxiella cheracis]|uniref:tetratricopeptide repeat protein n=1 Tax=Candidiatus Paracoxiella cheracis TaxID=3405120 RepID=UPI003BF54B4D